MNKSEFFRESSVGLSLSEDMIKLLGRKKRHLNRIGKGEPNYEIHKDKKRLKYHIGRLEAAIKVLEKDPHNKEAILYAKKTLLRDREKKMKRRLKREMNE